MELLKKYIVKGFAMNDDLLKRAGGATTLTNCLQEYVTSALVRRCSIARYWRFQRESRPRIRQIQGAYQEQPLACRDSLLGEL